MPTIQTERCTLAPLGPDDVDAMLTLERLLASDRAATLPPLDDTFYRGRMANWISDADPRLPSGMWKIVVDGQLIGRAGLDRSALADAPLLSYALAPAMRGRGYASEAVMVILAWAFGATHVEAIMAIIRPANAMSIAVARRVGMTLHSRTDEHNLFFVKHTHK